MHQQAALVLDGMGGDSSGFTARQLTARVASDADLILAMTRVHRDRVLELAPNKLSRAFTLIEASQLVVECGAETIADLAALRPRLVVNDRLDITDPIGQSDEVFETVGAQIAEHIPPVLELFRSLCR